MLETAAEVRTLYVLEDRQGHRIVREASLALNRSICSYCNGEFMQLVALDREPGENEAQHRLRSMGWRGKK